MCPAPDDVLLELFQINTESMPSELARYFGDDTEIGEVFKRFVPTP
jgi:hypothetical protein